MQLLKNNKTLNVFFNLSFIKLSNIVVKYFLIVYLIKRLGIEGFGMLIWLDSIVQYVIYITGFGFEIYAAKYIVENQNNKEKIIEIVSSILVIKMLLFIICFITIYIVSLFYNFSGQSYTLYILLLAGIGEVFNLQWYFQAIQRLTGYTFIYTISKLVLICGSLLLVKSFLDLKIYALVFAFTNIFLGTITFYFIKKDINFKFKKVSSSKLKFFFLEGLLFFSGKISSLINSLGIILLIGVLFTKSDVAAYDVSIKIIMLFVLPFEILQITFLPILLREKSKLKTRNLLLFSTVLSIVFAGILYFSQNYFLLYSGGKDFMKYSTVLSQLVLLIPIVGVQIVIGSCCLIANGLNKIYNQTLYLYLLTMLIGLFFMKYFNFMTFMNIVKFIVIVEFTLLLSRFYFSVKNKVI